MADEEKPDRAVNTKTPGKKKATKKASSRKKATAKKITKKKTTKKKVSKKASPAAETRDSSPAEALQAGIPSAQAVPEVAPMPLAPAPPPSQADGDGLSTALALLGPLIIIGVLVFAFDDGTQSALPGAATSQVTPETLVVPALSAPVAETRSGITIAAPETVMESVGMSSSEANAELDSLVEVPDPVQAEVDAMVAQSVAEMVAKLESNARPESAPAKTSNDDVPQPTRKPLDPGPAVGTTSTYQRADLGPGN